MTWYVAITRLNGRVDWIRIAEQINRIGFDGDRVEYSDGGWADKEIPPVSPHPKFKYEEDAMVYVIAFGGKITTNLPVKS